MDQINKTGAAKKVVEAMKLSGNKLIKVTGGQRFSALPLYCPYCGGQLIADPMASHEYEEVICTGCGRRFNDEPEPVYVKG